MRKFRAEQYWRQPPDALAPTMVFDPAINQPADADRSPVISRAGRKLQEEIAERKRADKRKLSIGAAVVAGFIAVIVGLVAWQKAGETTLIVEWPLDERDGAAIEIDGRAVTLGSEAHLRFSGPEGRRTLKVTREGYQPIEATLEFTWAETKTFRPEWEPTVETARQEQLAALQQRVDAFLQASRRVHPPGPDGGDKPRRSLDDPNLVALRNELVEFRGKHRGATESIDAAKLMSRLAWPVDELRQDGINPYELRMARTVDPTGINSGEAPPLMQFPELIAVLGDSRFKHSGRIGGLAFSRDGESLLSFGDDHAITRVWSVASGQQRWSDIVPAYGSPSLSDNGKLVATGSSGFVCLVDLSNGKELWRRGLGGTGATGSFYSMAISDDGRDVAAGTSGGQIVLWDAATGKLKKTSPAFKTWVMSLDFSPDGKTLAAGVTRPGSTESQFGLWDIETNDVTVVDQPATVRAVTFSPDGRSVLFSTGGRIHQADRTLQNIRQLFVSGLVHAFRFGPDGSLLLTAGDVPKVWDAASWKLRKQFVGHVGTPDSGFIGTEAVFHPDGKTVATGGKNGVIRLWDVETGNEKLQRGQDRSKPWVIATSPDGTLVAVGTTAGDVVLWNLRNRTKQHTLKGHSFPIRSIDFSTDGQWLVTADIQLHARVWNLAADKKQVTSKQYEGWVWTVEFMNDSNTIVSHDREGRVNLWNAATAKKMRELKTRATILTTRVAADRATLLLGTDDASLIAWDVAADTPGRRIATSDNVLDIVVSPDRKLIVTRTSAAMQLRDLATGKQLQKFSAIHAAFSPNGRMLATTAYEDKVELWSIKQRKSQSSGKLVRYASPMKTIPSHPGYTHGGYIAGGIRDLTFTPDGRHLITANGNGTIYVLRLKEWSAE